jgi:hypothetical protein
MDRARRRSERLRGPLATLALISIGAAPANPPLNAMRWLAPGADAARILTRRPVECLRLPGDADEAWRVEVGRAAFRSPLLLGGQAARAGVACETCHRNGRTNPDFDFPGVSGAPGTADVTSFVFSAHRGDHLDDPRPIPDLGGPKTALKIPQAPGSPALSIFIHGLVTEEFEGAEPPPAVLAGLAAYVRAMNPAACPAGGAEAVTAADAVEDVRRAVQAAVGALQRGDAQAAASLIQAARAMLGAIAERYGAPSLAATRARLDLAALELAGALDEARSGDRAAAESLAVWLAHAPALAAALERDEPRSLYDRAVLAAAIKAPASPVK